MSDPTVSNSWRNDPQADFLIFQLVRLAGAALREHFDNEEPEKAYKAWLRREARRKTGGKPTVLREWEEHPEYATLSLTAHPIANTFALALSHTDFTAEVWLTFNVDLDEIEGASIRHFHGDVTRAVEGSDKWLGEFAVTALDDLDMDDIDITPDDLDEMLRDATGPDDDDDENSGEPPEGTPEDRRRLERMARTLSQRVRDDAPPQLSEGDETWLTMAPHTLLPMLEAAIAAASKKPRDQRLFAAWVAMLTYQLEQVRYSAERGRDWADAMLDDYQRRLLALAPQDKIAHEDLFSLVAALGHAKVAVDPVLSEALLGAGPTFPGSIPMEQALEHAVRPLIDELARNVSTPFDLMEALSESAAVVPGDLRSFMALELALSPHEVMRTACR